MSLCAAARVDARLSPSDAARQSGRVPQGRDQAARQGLSPHRRHGRALANPVSPRPPMRQQASSRCAARWTTSPRFDAEAWMPEYASRRCAGASGRISRGGAGRPAGRTKGKVALFTTCYINRNEPEIGEDLVAVYAAQRHSRHPDAEGKMLRHAQARARRPRSGQARQGVQHSRACGAGGSGL